jgi:hypothetical protein
MSNKKGIMLEFLVRLIIAIVFISGAIAIGRSFFRLTSQSGQSFDEVVTLIQEVQEGKAELLNGRLIMDTNTAIVGYNKDSEYVTRKIRAKNIPEAISIPLFYSVNRPSTIECELTKTCICLFKEGRLDIHSQFKNPICIELEGVTFVEKTKEFSHYDKKDLSKNNENLAQDKNVTQRYHSVYVQGYKKKISVCLESPCITDEMKRQIDASP